MLVLTKQQIELSKPEWTGSVGFQSIQLNGVELVVRRNAENARYSGFINKRRVFDDAIDLRTAQVDIIYELEIMVENLNSAISQLRDISSR